MDFVRKTPPSAGQVVDFKQLIRETLPFYGQIVDFKQLIRETSPIYGRPEHLESTFYSNKVSWWQAGQPHTAKS